MKLVTFLGKAQREYIGTLVDDGRRIAVLQAGIKEKCGKPSAYFSDMLAFLEGGEAARDEAQETTDYIVSQKPPEMLIALSDVILMAPVPRPESIRDCMAFEQHVINSTRVAGLKRFGPIDEWIEKYFGRKRSLAYLLNKEWYKRPIYYKGNRFSVVGTDADVHMPAFTQQFDYELEWGIYIGKQGRDISKQKARSYIGGYTIFNDFSCRDIQMREMKGRLGFAKSKDFDTGNVMGPYLVTQDEIPDPYTLTMTARINGDEWSRGSSSEMDRSFEEIIAYVSRSETLHPGEFIGSGTCTGSQGRGCGLEMGKFLKKGDLVELEVERIGILRNRICA